MPDVSPNLELINRAERVLRDEEGAYDLMEYQAVIENLLVALMGRETQIALMYALINEGEAALVAQNGTEYRVTYPRGKGTLEPTDTRTFKSGEEMLDLALYLKQDCPEHADHVVMETREVFVGPWRKL